MGKKYKLRFYHPNYMDIDDPDGASFDTKEELLANEEIKRVSRFEYHIRWEQITKEEPVDAESTLMHIVKGEDGEEFWVKAFITPCLEEQMFPEWKYENYGR